MKKYLFCLTIMATAIAFAPQTASAQNAPLGKGINKEGIKRGENLQRQSPTEILSLVAPSTGLSLEKLLELHQIGSITIHPVQNTHTGTRVEIRNVGILIATVTVKCNTCGQGGPLLSVPTGTGTRF